MHHVCTQDLSSILSILVIHFECICNTEDVATLSTNNAKALSCILQERLQVQV